VVVWIHNGAYVTGRKELYNLTSFAQHGVVAIVINYRLGIWAYLHIHQTSPENYALLNQVQALKWVRDNIKQFGGDPNCLTIQGQFWGRYTIITSCATSIQRSFPQSIHAEWWWRRR